MKYYQFNANDKHMTCSLHYSMNVNMDAHTITFLSSNLKKKLFFFAISKTSKLDLGLQQENLILSS